MAGRFTGPHEKSGDVAASPEARNIAKLLLGEMQESMRLGGVTTQVRRKTLPDGSTVEARLVAGVAQVTFGPPLVEGGGLEEITYAYISSAGGLRIFDLGAKRLERTIVGLHPYEVNGVSRNGTFVYMSGNNVAVRVDAGAKTAFGYSYPMDALLLDNSVVPARASVSAGLLSPDDTLLLNVVDQIYDPVTAVVLEALGGFILATAKTLVPVRTPIRMSFRRQCAAWAADSKHFYIAAAVNTDSNGVPVLTVSTSTADYIACFDRAGVLQGTRQVSTWGFTPSAGFNRRVYALATNPQNTRLYAIVRLTDLDTYTLVAINTVDPLLPIVASLPMTAPGAAPVMNVHPGGDKLTVLFSNDTIGEFDVANDVLVQKHRTGDAFFDVPLPTALNQFSPRAVQNTPKSPRRTQFLYNVGEQAFRAYTAFDKSPVYTFVPSPALALKNRYALAAVGRRPIRKKA